MKKRLLFAFLLVGLSFLTASAQDCWLDEDFSSQKWQDAVRGWIDEAGGELTFPEATPSNVDIADGTVINGFTFNGAYIRPGAAELLLACPMGDTHQYGFRLRRSEVSYIQLPQVANAKKISIHIRNGNANNESSILLEEYDETSSSWNLLETISVQPANAYMDQDEVVEVDLNKETPVTLRLSRGGNFFVAIYKIAVEKSTGGSSVHSMTVEAIDDLHVDNRTLLVTGRNAVTAHLLLFDVCGKIVYESTLDGNKIELPASVQSGTYIAKLVSKEVSLAKKICVR